MCFREEDDAVALVRVYCGLASTGPVEAQPNQEVWLTVAVVDDAGRLLDVCEITDDAGGYAELSAMLAHRAGGSSAAAVATDSDDHVVIQLLTAAGRHLAYTDEDSADDYAERFADEASPEEAQASAPQRRSIGLARALQAGVLSAVPQGPPRDMIALKPLLSAHAALVAGRQGSAATLREVLRELYPAALRAYPDPAEPIPLAILDALPEPGLLGSGQATRSRDAQIVADLTAAGLSDSATLDEAVAALRQAIVETPRRTGVTRALTSAVAETIRQSVSSVQACDKATGALVEVLGNKMSSRGAHGRPRAIPSPAPRQPAADTRQAQAAPPQIVLETTPQYDPNRGRVLSAPPAAHVSGPPAHMVSAPPAHVVSGPPAHVVSAPPAAHVSGPPAHVSGPPVPTGSDRASRQNLANQFPRRSGMPAAAPAPPKAPPAVPQEPQQGYPMGNPPFRPSMAPQFNQQVPYEGSPFVQQQPAQVSGAGYNPFASGPAQPTPAPTSGSPTASFPDSPHFGSDARDYETTFRPGDAQLAPPRLDSAIPPPGTRSAWPLAGDTGSDYAVPGSGVPYGSDPLTSPSDSQRALDMPKQREGRVVPPWQSDDLPAEPPSLRVVEPPLDLSRSNGSGYGTPLDEFRVDPPALRLVDSDRDRGVERSPQRTSSRRPRAELPEPPVALNDRDEDGDLLIFAATRSAWFIDEPDTADELSWSTSAADAGWQAAQHASRPAVGTDTRSGLPRRVPQQNLVPGSILGPQDRPLRIVRDAAAIAANTTGYFQGWRRGQEVGGYSLGGRPGRESAGGWDFTRDTGRDGAEREFEYRSAHR
ncbi:MAG: transposase [Micromonosporaceae bacterium]|nr:transposase [Micromonosporaceae bacterium]